MSADLKSPVASGAGSRSHPRSPEASSIAAGLMAGLAGWLGMQAWPEAELGCFARGAAGLASLLTGAPVLRVATGWMLPVTGQTVVVTAACSATDYFLMLAALLAWQLARRGRGSARAVGLGLLVALPLTIFLNALRVVAVTHAHRWLIPLLPASYGPFLHLLTGVAIFLPALVALNLLLEFYGNPRPATAR